MVAGALCGGPAFLRRAGEVEGEFKGVGVHGIGIRVGVRIGIRVRCGICGFGAKGLFRTIGLCIIELEALDLAGVGGGVHPVNGIRGRSGQFIGINCSFHGNRLVLGLTAIRILNLVHGDVLVVYPLGHAHVAGELFGILVTSILLHFNLHQFLALNGRKAEVTQRSAVKAVCSKVDVVSLGAVRIGKGKVIAYTVKGIGYLGPSV